MVLPVSRILEGKISATHCSEVRADDRVGESKESESARDHRHGEVRVTWSHQARYSFPGTWGQQPAELGRAIYWKGNLCREHGNSIERGALGSIAPPGGVPGKRPTHYLYGLIVSPLAKGTGPSSTTSVGIAPLPCNMDTTLSWEQFLQRRWPVRA